MIPGSGTSPGEGNGNLLQYSCLENPLDRGAEWATVYRVEKSWTRLTTEHTHKLEHMMAFLGYQMPQVGFGRQGFPPTRI